MTDKRLDILHDHYKESFSYIREWEKLRDRLFLFLIGLFALLVLEVQYPINFTGAFGKVSVLGAEIQLDSLPLAALLSASWVLTLAIALRYCQSSIHVERQYTYIHALEEKIARELGDEDVYCREGKAYTRNYPRFSNWTWFSYTVLFPVVVALATLVLISLEWTRLGYHWGYKLFDSTIAAGVILSFALYRLPMIAERVQQSVAGRRSKK